MGNKADNILSSLSLSDNDKKSYNTVRANLEQHFVRLLSMNVRGLTRDNKRRAKMLTHLSPLYIV